MSQETSQDRLLAWAERHVTYKKGYRGKHYSPFICHIMNMFDKRLRWSVKKGVIITCQDKGYLCEWCSPYGFVADASCPKHGG